MRNVSFVNQVNEKYSLLHFSIKNSRDCCIFIRLTVILHSKMMANVDLLRLIGIFSCSFGACSENWKRLALSSHNPTMQKRTENAIDRRNNRRNNRRILEWKSENCKLRDMPRSQDAKLWISCLSCHVLSVA